MLKGLETFHSHLGSLGLKKNFGTTSADGSFEKKIGSRTSCAVVYMKCW